MYRLINLNTIVSDFIRRYRKPAKRGLRHRAKQRTLKDAIHEAAVSRPNGKRHAHQRRIPGHVLALAERHLQRAAGKLRNAACFRELHDAVEQEIGSIKGIGPLTVYDVSQRIGAFFGIEPDAVYLHAGTRDGARAFGLSGKYIARTQLPRAFLKLSPGEIEDCLCIYKDQLRGLNVSTSRSGCLPARSLRRNSSC